MIHPLKAATSFDCDGCGHHASFHKMNNQMDEEIVRRWKADETIRDQFHAKANKVLEIDIGFKGQQHANQNGMIEDYENISENGQLKRRRIESGPGQGFSDDEGIIEVPRRETARPRRRKNDAS